MANIVREEVSKLIVLILLFTIICTYFYRGIDFYLDLHNYGFNVNLLIGFKFLFWSTSSFIQQFIKAVKNKELRFAKSILRVFVCHYGAIRTASIGFLKEAREMFECGEANILQDNPEEFVGNPQENPSSKLIVEWLRNSISQLFQPKMSERLFSI